MDALFALDKGAFRTTSNHIALYREPPSELYLEIANAATKAAGYRAGDFQTWNIPEFSSLLGKSVPIDVHGKHIFFDEAALGRSSTKPSVIRYYILAGALRTKAGGRRWYDIRTMNMSLFVGASAGAGFLYFGQKRWRWMMTRPYMRVFASFGICVFTTYAVRITTRTLGMGTFAAQRNFTKAIDLMQCGQCIDEVRDFTEHQIEDLGKYEVPKLPNGQEVPEQVQDMIRRGNEAHSMMLGINVRTMKMASNKYKETHCQWHTPSTQ